MENKLVVTSGRRKGKWQYRDGAKKKVYRVLYDFTCVKLLKTVKHYRI